MCIENTNLGLYKQIQVLEHEPREVTRIIEEFQMEMEKL